MYNFYIDKMNVLFVFIITVFAYILSYKNFQYMDKDDVFYYGNYHGITDGR